jgi:competence protein ComEC
MMVFLIVCFICGLFSSFGLLSKLADYSKILQETCSGAFTEALAAAFVCGSDIANSHVENVFRQSGLVHLMVVSGGHLQIIENFILLMIPERWLEHKLWRLSLLAVLISYTFFTGFQPPVVRALTSLLLRLANSHWRWSWSGLQIQWLTGLLLLCLEPRWIFNFSFYLSWLASLGLLLAPWCFLKPRKRKLTHSIAYFWFSTFCVQSLVAFAFCGFSLLGLWMNFLFAPLLSLGLLPLSLLSLWFSWCSTIWKWLVQFLEWTVQNSSFAISVGEFPQTYGRWIFLWMFVAILHGLLWALQRQRYQGSAQ